MLTHRDLFLCVQLASSFRTPVGDAALRLNAPQRQQLRHRHKLIALLLQMVHGLQRRLHGAEVAVMQQDNIPIGYLPLNDVQYFPCVFAFPILRIH